MIRDQSQITINASPDQVFTVIEEMPNKFPAYKIMDTRPMIFMRLLFVDGLRSAIDSYSLKTPIEDVFIMKLSDSYGPFKLTTVEKPSKYWFTLKSFFFNCRTGYNLGCFENQTKLEFFLVTDNPSFSEKLYWILVKPIHAVLARKVLKEIKAKVENLTI